MSPRHLATTIVSTLAVLTVAPHLMFGADAEPSLEARVRALEQQLQAAQAKPVAGATASPVITADLGNGFSITSADNQYRFRLSSYIQADGRYFINDEADTLTNTMLIRRARIIADGSLGMFDFRVMPDFGNGTATLLDAYISANLNPAFKIQAGRFKVPIGLEHLQSDSCVAMIERGFPSQLVPARDNGVMLSGAWWDGRLGYQVGVFNGATDGANRDSDNGDDKDGVLRLYGTPFKGGPDLLSGMLVGIGGSYGVENGTIGTAASGALPSFRTSGHNVFFAYAATTTAGSGSHWRVAPQLYYALGPFGLTAEYTISEQEVVSAVEEHDIANHAWNLVANWVLTGEKATYRGVAPAHPVTRDGGGWGAWEVIARAHQIDIDDEAFSAGFAAPNTAATRATAFGVGVTWHLTNYMQIMLNYERTDFVDGAGAALAPTDRATEHLIESRLQLLF